MQLPKDVLYEIFRRLPIDIRLALRVKPGRITHSTHIDSVLRKKVMVQAQHGIHHAHVYVDGRRYAACVVADHEERQMIAFVANQDNKFFWTVRPSNHHVDLFPGPVKNPDRWIFATKRTYALFLRAREWYEKQRLEHGEIEDECYNGRGLKEDDHVWKHRFKPKNFDTLYRSIVLAS